MELIYYNSQELQEFLKQKHINYKTCSPKEKKLLIQEIIKNLQDEKNLKEKELVKAYEEWANDPKEWTDEDEAWID